MIKHIVMWTLKDEAEGACAAENAAKMKEMLEGLNGRIEILKHLEVSADVFESAPECGIILYSEFDSKEDLQTYAVHPLHLACVDFIKKIVKSRSVVDYVI